MAKSRKIPFSYAGRQLEARAVPLSSNWELWIYENKRALSRYALIPIQTVNDAGRYDLDLLSDEMSAMIEAVKTRQLVPLPTDGA